MDSADDARATPAGSPPSPADAESFTRLKSALAQRYALEAELARGGMGTVLRARDLRHDRPVAVKVLRPDVSTSLAASRFVREVRTAAGLVHPNIVTVFDSGEADGLLYYIMPLVEGESLRARLDRDGPLPIADAIRIAAQVADALAFAHARGVVHRDIKPENILLAAHGHAQVTDFGIARALSEAADPRLTGTGVFVGSPLYMSPEQASGEPVDGRADVYALGCVLYEMLVGTPPFEGPSLTAILTRRLMDEPPRVRATRSEVPAPLDDLVARCMARSPADRPAGARELADALVQGTLPASAPANRARPGRRAILAGLALTAAVAAVGLGLRFGGGVLGGAALRLGRREATLDPTRLAVFPFLRGPGVPADLAEADRLRDALTRWRGLDVIEPGDAGADDGRASAEGVDPAKARGLARDLRAGRFITGRITREGDSLRIYAQLGDADGDERVRARIRLAVPALAPRLSATFQAMADSLALAGSRPECVAGSAGTLALAAVQACDRAFAALDDGDLALADTALQQALAADPRYPRAALWLAQMRGWLAERPPASPELLAVVNGARDALSPRERTLADALGLMVATRYADACRAYAALVAADSLDVPAWLGLGECHRRDDVVLRDPRSPSGWAFRSSYNQAVLAYKRAFEIRPRMMAGWRTGSYLVLRDVLGANPDRLRPGRAGAQAPAIFLARLSAVDDSLVYVPFPASAVLGASPRVDASRTATAVETQRRLFLDLATHWAALTPRAADAVEALAVAMELRGDAGALQQLRRARSLTTRPDDRLRIGAEEVWLDVKLGIPKDIGQLAAARSLADSLLNDSSDPSADPDALAALASLTGRTADAARFARRSTVSLAAALRLPAGVVAPAQAMLAFAVAGEPGDSLETLEAEFEGAVNNLLPLNRQNEARQALLARPALIVFPTHRLRALPGLTGYLAEAEQAVQAGRPQRVRAILKEVDSARAGLRAGDLSMDVLYPEAWLRAEAGDPEGAAAHLDAVLGALSWTPPASIGDLAVAGSLVRSCALRSDLALRAHDAVRARLWAAVVAVLWKDADPALQPLVGRMRSIAGNAFIPRR